VIEGDVPVARSASVVAAARREDAVEFALAGGEEFELLAAIDARAFGYLAGRYAARFGRPLLPVGRLREGEGLFRRIEGADIPLEPMGWDHIHG